MRLILIDFYLRSPQLSKSELMNRSVVCASAEGWEKQMKHAAENFVLISGAKRIIVYQPVIRRKWRKKWPIPGKRLKWAFDVQRVSTRRLLFIDTEIGLAYIFSFAGGADAAEGQNVIPFGE